MLKMLLIRTESSGLLAPGSSSVYEGDGVLTSVGISTNFNDNVTVTIYDNTSAAGKVIFHMPVPGDNGYGGRNWVFPVEFLIGLYRVVTGTGGGATIEYSTQRLQ